MRSGCSIRACSASAARSTPTRTAASGWRRSSGGTSGSTTAPSSSTTRAKSGKQQLHSFTDPAVREILAALKRRRGPDPTLLAYRGARWVAVRSDEINAYIKATAGDEFSAKDFRTWHATVFAAVALAESPPAASRAARERAIVDAVAETAERLGNTPAVCRASYIDPRVIERYRAGETIASTLARLGRRDRQAPKTRQRLELAVIRLLE